MEFDTLMLHASVGLNPVVTQDLEVLGPRMSQLSTWQPKAAVDRYDRLIPIESIDFIDSLSFHLFENF